MSAVNEFTSGFGQSTEEKTMLLAMLSNLLRDGIEFDVRDDRGGTGQWFVVVRTSASKRILPDAERWVQTGSTPARGVNIKRWSAEAAFGDLLDEIDGFLEAHEDVRDGDGGPRPNRAMSLRQDLRDVRAIRERNQ